MHSFTLLLSFAISVAALTTPHQVSHHHRAIAARVAHPVTPELIAPAVSRRQTSRRCKQRPVNNSTSTAVPTSTKSSPLAQAPSPPPSPSPSPKPTTSTSQAPAPTTTSTKAPAPAPSPPGNSGNLPSFMIGTQTGDATFYATGLGACGITNHDTDFIVAVSHSLFDAFPNYKGVNPNNNPICGRKINANYQGNSVQVIVTDRCGGCQLTDLDFSPSAYEKLGAFSVGRLKGMTWTWA